MNQEMEIGMNNKFVVESEFINKFIINNRIEGNDLVLTFVYLNNFYNANLENVIFSNAIMKHTNFKDVTLKNVNFSNTELTGSNFDDTALTNTSLDNAIINSPKELTDYWNWWLNLTPEEKELIQK